MKKTVFLALLSLSLPFAASAQDSTSGLSYNYVQAGYTKTDIDTDGWGEKPDVDGWGLNGSFAVAPNFHVFAGYTKQTMDYSFLGMPESTDISQYRLGVGYNRSVTDRMDFVGRLAYENFNEGDGRDVLDGNHGYSVEAGVRAALGTHFEGYAFAGYEDWKQADGDFYGRLGAQGKFNQNWGMTADVKFDGDVAQWFVGPRFTW